MTRLHITVPPDPFKKKEKKRKYNGLTGRQKSFVGLIFLLGLLLNTETPTLEIVTCKLPLRLRDIFFQYILRQWIVFFGCSDWLLNRRISCTLFS